MNIATIVTIVTALFLRPQLAVILVLEEFVVVERQCLQRQH